MKDYKSQDTTFIHYRQKPKKDVHTVTIADSSITSPRLEFSVQLPEEGFAFVKIVEISFLVMGATILIIDPETGLSRSLEKSITCLVLLLSAAIFFSSIRRRRPQSINDIVHEGFGYLKKQDFQKAVTTFNKGLAINPHDIDSLVGFGAGFQGLREITDIINKPSSWRLHRTIEFLKKTFGPIKSDDKFSSGFSIDITNSCTIARYCRDFGLKSLNTAIELNPTNAYAYFVRGCFLETDFQHKDAIISYQKALEYSPKDIPTLMCLGKLLYYNRDYHTGIECLNKVLEIDRDYETALYYKALCLKRQPGEALPLYEKLLVLNSPRHINIRDELKSAFKEFKGIDYDTYVKRKSVLVKLGLFGQEDKQNLEICNIMESYFEPNEHLPSSFFSNNCIIS